MPVTEGRARSRADDRLHLVLVAPRWSASELALADEAIERFFGAMRRARDELEREVSTLEG